MLFQTLDDKTECVGIFVDNKLQFNLDALPDNLSKTWSYAPYLRDQNVEYASLYLEGKKLTDIIPEYLKDDWSDISKKITAFKRSLHISQVDTYENCFFDLVPTRFLVEWCEIKNKITEHVFKTVEKPRRYGFYHHATALLTDIGNRKINIDKRTLKSFEKDPKLSRHVATVLERPPYVKYNLFGTRTGRLSTKQDSFPILTLPKSLRAAIVPQNDYFLEIDFNGAEVRTLLGLMGKEQPENDIHEFHLSNIFKTLTTREEAKVAFFAWLYGSTATNKEEVEELNKFYDKDLLLSKYWTDGTITTPYGKQINNVDAHHALNYLIQSTAADLALKQSLKVDHLLRKRGSGSHLSFLIHDSVVIDMKDSDSVLLPGLVELMSSTNFGRFQINLSKGSSLSNMRKLNYG